MQAGENNCGGRINKSTCKIMKNVPDLKEGYSSVYHIQLVYSVCHIQLEHSKNYFLEMV